MSVVSVALKLATSETFICYKTLVPLKQTSDVVNCGCMANADGRMQTGCTTSSDNGDIEIEIETGTGTL